MITDERVAKFIDTCRAMADAGDGARYDWWDDLTTALVELQGLRARGNVPVNARERMYYPIIMPLNADGYGPASEERGEIRKITWQVWDQFCDTFGDFDCLPDAIMEAERLNRTFYASPAATVGQKQQPVAWVNPATLECLSERRDHTTAILMPSPKEGATRPLYASPQPEAAITEDMVERAAKAILYDRFGSDADAFFEVVPDAFPNAIEARTLFARRISEANSEARASLTAALDSQGGGE
jgi:hypothetical protein